jgi:hypothetical protein
VIYRRRFRNFSLLDGEKITLTSIEVEYQIGNERRLSCQLRS